MLLGLSDPGGVSVTPCVSLFRDLQEPWGCCATKPPCATCSGGICSPVAQCLLGT